MQNRRTYNRFVIHLLCLTLAFLLFVSNGWAQVLRKPIPDKLIVLTFDDASRSHATFVAPILKKYGFGGTFYVCEFAPDFADKTKYLTWEQIRQVDRVGFEIGNHTFTHKNLAKLSKPQLTNEVDSLEILCKLNHIRKPVTFAYPAYFTSPIAFDVLAEKKYQFARVGGDRAYDPAIDHPLLVPSYSMTDSNKEIMMHSLQEAKNGKVVVWTIHGVPDIAHPWVNIPPALFEEYMKFLHDNQYKVISMRDLLSYVNSEQAVRLISLPTK
ncbi:polysaccharide deacetylase family protein [Spirosoma flavum]|uniref:Polysaccharide deacetylase family protein n=1 Tax=Spirosoma flavum TaxID=2048557 RepID=A0ABW6ANB6_9BACT